MMVMWRSFEPIKSCDTIGKALHPSVPPVMDTVMDTDKDFVEQDHVIWRIMSFFESYADLQVSMIHSQKYYS